MRFFFEDQFLRLNSVKLVCNYIDIINIVLVHVFTHIFFVNLFKI
jgi:hypothetical protein